MTLSAPLAAPPGDWTAIKPARNVGTRPFARAEELTGLGKLAFTSLWLLLFAIPWEDAITISGFGTSARLIGTGAVVLGFMAILEKGSLRRPAAGHFMMALFVISAAGSYLWSLYPEGTLTQTVTYIQLLVLVWLIWELAPTAEAQKRLMQAYILGTFVSGIDTIYMFLSHQESSYQRYAGARLDANDLGLMMALSIPVSYCLLIQGKGLMAWVYRLQLALAGTTVLLRTHSGSSFAVSWQNRFASTTRTRPRPPPTIRSCRSL